jgi:uncharacterized protein YndB with AHSA1/START domain
MNVRRTIEVGLTLEEAFSLFTTGIGEWWPLRQGFSYGGERCDSIHLEPKLGGRFFERFVDGDEFQVGTVTACEVPHRIVFTWAPPSWPGATEVEVRFSAGSDSSTTVDLEHRGFEALGTDGQATRDGFANGWPSVLDGFGRRAAQVAERD